MILDFPRVFDEARANARSGDNYTPDEVVGVITDAEYQALFLYRSTIVRTILEERGLLGFYDDIIDGIDKSDPRIIDEDTWFSDVSAMRAGSEIYLTFARKYIDRWQMYNDLFGADKPTPV